MLVSMDQVQRGAANYFETEFCQKAAGIDKFAMYFALPSIPQLIAKKIEPLRGSPLAEGMINQDGLIEIDAVRDRAANAMQHCGTLEVMGFRLDANDVDKLYEAIRRA